MMAAMIAAATTDHGMAINVAVTQDGHWWRRLVASTLISDG